MTQPCESKDAGEMPTDEMAQRVERVVDAWRKSYTGYPLELHEQTDEEREAGVQWFSYADPELGWSIRGLASIGGKRPIIRSITVDDINGDEVTAGLLKSVPLGKITASLQELVLIETYKQVFHGPNPGKSVTDFLGHPSAALDRILAVMGEVTGAERKTQSGGRSTMSPELLREVAEAYLEETAPGKGRKPLARLATRFDRPEETIRTWLARARRDGWLSPAVKGRVGADPGPRLLAARAEEPKD